MVQATPTGPVLDRAVTIRALSSLTRRDADAVRATVRASGNRFVVQEHDDYDGYLSLLLTAAPDDDRRSAFLVSGRTGAIDVAELRGDEMTPIGCFPSIGPAMMRLRPMLEQEHGGDRSARMDARRMIDRHGSDADLHAAMRADATAGTGWAAILRAIDSVNDV